MELYIFLPAFFAGAIVLLSHVPLGLEVLNRGVIFTDLAIAQFAGLGIIFASWLGFETHGIELQLFALAGAFLGASLLTLSEKMMPHDQEAAIGALFILAATGSLILLANNVHGGEQLKDLLVGQILWVEWLQLLPALVIGLLVFSISIWKPVYLTQPIFYFLFAIAITQSVQLVGIYLVFASLIMPALFAKLLRHKFRYLLAFSLGVLAYVFGLYFSALLDLPSGAVIVWTMFGVNAIATCVILVSRNVQS